MTKPIIQLHTIDQWVATDASTRSLILQNIKLKERLNKFLKVSWQQNQQERKQQKADGFPDKRLCQVCEGRGWLPTEPRRPGIHPSQLPHPCLLKVYNEMIGKEAKEESIETRLMLIFETGHSVHDMLQSYGKKGAWGPIYKSEVRLSKEFQELSEELMLEGYADAENVLTLDDIPNSQYVYEVGLVHEYKTINSRAFEKLTKPKPEHRIQAMVYAAALNRPIVTYLYFNKNDQNLVDFPVAFEHELWGSIEAKAKILKKAFEDKIPPPGSVSFHCQECPYVYDCSAYAEVNKK